MAGKRIVTPQNVRRLQDAVLEFLRATTPEALSGAEDIIIDVHTGNGLPLLVLGIPRAACLTRVGTSAPAEAEEPFVPNSFQDDILDALEGRALRTDAIAAKVGDRNRLFRPGGLKELQAHGYVAHHSRLGFYRPDAPPEELAGE